MKVDECVLIRGVLTLPGGETADLDGVPAKVIRKKKVMNKRFKKDPSKWSWDVEILPSAVNNAEVVAEWGE